MDKPHILIVDDDTRILKLLARFLEKNDYIVSTAESASEAEEYMKKFVFDLVILDVMMPKTTGTEFAKSVKNNKIHVPIILLTALSEIEHKIEGFSSGADDYMTKPFDPQELLLRTKNLIEIYGYKRNAESLRRFGSKCYYNLNTKELIRNDCAVHLGSSERKLLELLIASGSKVVSREEIATVMGLKNERSVDVQIVKLRGKIEDDTKYPKFLRTIRNAGYALY